MTIWFTSDTHFSHARIIELCDRPFKDVQHMDEMIIQQWNEMVALEDTVYHLGDVALGTIADSLPKVGRLNGRKILVPGNHDRVSAVESDARRQRFWPLYLEVFAEIAPEHHLIDLDGHEVLLSHYPYQGDSQDKDRHVDLRPEDQGLPLVHGHTHNANSREHGNMFHVGMDAWDYRPVHQSLVTAWIDSL